MAACSEPAPPVRKPPEPAKVVPVPTPLPLPPPAPSASVPPLPETPDDAGDVVALKVPGFGDAVVAIARSGEDPHPIVIAAHANWDRPSWECAFWKRLFPESFILCPRGILRPDSPSEDDPRFTYEDDEALEAELEAGLLALEARFPGRVTQKPSMLWVGLSRGAFLGAHIAARHPSRFPRLILVEGGHDPWTPANAKKFAAGGGKRVHFVCGQGACSHLARKAARVLEHFHVATRLDDVAGMGHGLNGDADAPILAALPWLFGLDE